MDYDYLEMSIPFHHLLHQVCDRSTSSVRLSGLFGHKESFRDIERHTLVEVHL